jgi:hypothetical protein
MKELILEAGETARVRLKGEIKDVDYQIQSSKKKCSAQMVKESETKGTK